MRSKTSYKLLTLVAVVGVTLTIAYAANSQRKNAEVGAKTENAELFPFRDRQAMPLVHFRVTLEGDTFGSREHADGRIERVTDYHVAKSSPADFFVEPGAERLLIDEVAPGKRVALYVKNLRVINTTAPATVEVDIIGFACNIGFSMPNGRWTMKHFVERHGTADAPKAQRFKVGEPVKQIDGATKDVLRKDAAGDEVNIATHTFHTIELVGVTDLASVLKDDPKQDEPLPGSVREAIQRDRAAATLPSATTK